MVAAVSLKMAVLAAVLAVIFAAPPQQERELRMDVTDVLNNALEKALENVTDPLPLGNITLTTDDDMFQLTIAMESTTLAGIKDLAAHDSTIEGVGLVQVDFRVLAGTLTLATDHYTISGTVVDHIEMQGEGPATIFMENFDIILTGKVNVLTTQFTEIYLDLELWRWTVDFEGLMPGTDLGTVFNEFFTMCGPELVDMLEKKINESGKLLDFVNGILSGTGGGAAELTSLIASSFQKIDLQHLNLPFLTQ